MTAPVQWRPIELPAGGGINTKTDEKLLQPPMVADLQNIVFTESPGWKKRNGYIALKKDAFSVSDIAAANALGTFRDEILLFDDKHLYTYSENLEKWKQRDRVFAPDISIRRLLDQPENQTKVEYAVSGDIAVTAWVSDSDSLVHYEVRDKTTGSIITADTTLSGSVSAKAIGNDQSVNIIFYNSSATSLRALTIPSADPTNTSNTELVTDMHADGLYDAALDTFEGLKTVVIYKQTTAVTYGFVLSATGSASSIGTLATETDSLSPGVLSINSATGTAPAGGPGGGDTTKTVFTIAVSEGSGGSDIVANQLDNTLTALQSSTSTGSFANVVNVQIIADNTDTAHMWIEQSGASPHLNTVKYVADKAFSAIYSGTTTYRHSSIASKAFLHNDVPYVVLAHESTLQSKYFLFDCYGNLHGRFLDGVGVGNTAQHLPSVITDGSDYVVPLGIRKRLTIDPEETQTAGNVFTEKGARLVRMGFGASGRYDSVEVGGASYIRGGFLQKYDGTNVYEQGFHLFPENITAADNVDGAGVFSAAEVYNYRVYYEYTAPNGERTLSTTAAVISHTVGGGAADSVTLTIPTLQHSAVASDVSIVVYRTTNGASVTAGAPFYRVSDPDPANGAGNNRYVVNDPTSDTVTFIDADINDTNLTAKELDYLNTGELDNTAAPAGKVMGYAKQRLWVADTDDNGTAAYFSKLRTPANAVEFHDGNYVQLPDEGGRITAVGELNHFAVFFKKDRIYVVSGEGPDNLGRGAFNNPQLVTADVGCSNPRSVVRFDSGLLFQSDKGIYQVTNNFEVSYIGAPVEAYNDQTITAATLVNDTNQIRFLTNSGRTLVYDYLFRQWTTFTNHTGVDAVLWKNQDYCYVTAAGTVMKESDTSFTDDGKPFRWLVRLYPVNVGGVQGFQRIKKLTLLGTYFSTHELQLRCNYDNGGFVDRGTWDPAGNVNVDTYGSGAYGSGDYGGTGSPEYRATFNLPRQKCRTVQFEISERLSSGRAMEIDHLQIWCGTKRGLGTQAAGYKFSATGGSTQ